MARRAVFSKEHVVVAVLFVAAVAAAFVVGGQVTSRDRPSAVASTTLTPAAVPAGASAIENAIVHALESASPSVVQISTNEGLGSGVVYDRKGDVVTNAHVVGSATSFSVLLSNGRRVAARLLGTFVPDDLAVIRLASPAGAVPARFANSATLKVGDIALAIGSPLGLTGSVTDGIVSSTSRAVQEPNGVLLPDTIQTSAAINPGNSGGALVDLAGQVIGIPTLAASGSSGAGAAGIGFAVPSNRVRLIAPQLIAKGKVTSAGRAALGVQGTTVTDGSGTPVGVYVVAATAGGPAAKAGVRVGDVITAIGGAKTPTFETLQAALAQLEPGATTTLTVRRGAATKHIRVVLGDLADG